MLLHHQLTKVHRRSRSGNKQHAELATFLLKDRSNFFNFVQNSAIALLEKLLAHRKRPFAPATSMLNTTELFDLLVLSNRLMEVGHEFSGQPPQEQPIFDFLCVKVI